MTIDHLVFNAHKFYPDTQVIKDYVDVSLIGKSITYSKYKVGWLKVPGGNAVEINNFDDSAISWTKPDNIDDNISATGKVIGVDIAKNKTPYYEVWFTHTVYGGSLDGLYDMLIKASDIMKQNIAGNGL